MIETWKAVVGYEGQYEVSDQGRVRSLDYTRTYERLDQYSGRVITVSRRHRGKMLRPGRMPAGHLSVALGRNNSICVHVLVLNAFVGPCPPGQECCHGDDVPWNNVLGNLRWGTRSSNLLDAVRTGKKLVGENWHISKLKNSDIPVIRSLFGIVSYREIGRRYGVSDSTIRQIKDGRSWKHIEVSDATQNL